MESLGRAIGCQLQQQSWESQVIIAFGGIWDMIFLKRNQKSPKRITPEIILTTDGKKVDTLFIYKKK